MATVPWGDRFTKTLSIGSGQTESDVLDLTQAGSRNVWEMMLLSPATLTGTITIEVAPIDTGTFRTLQSGGTDINPAAGKATMLAPFLAGAMKLVSSAAEGAQRDFEILGNFIRTWR